MPDFRDKIIYHSRLANILGNGEQHLSENELSSLTSGGNSTQHYHATDRDRTNHTGTQPASTISDFDTEVSNNTTVSDNTAKLSTIEENADATDAENVGSAIDGSPEDAAPIDTDQFAQTDSAGNLMWTAWGTIKSLIQTLTDTLYAPASDGVTGGNAHDHNGGDGAQIDHLTCGNIGTKSHAVLEAEINANTAKVSADGSVTTHSDITSAGSGEIVTSAERSEWNAKQNALTFDLIPTDNSTNPVESNGIFDAIAGKEDAFSKNTAFNKNFGTTPGTVCEGDDSRLTINTDGVTVHGAATITDPLRAESKILTDNISATGTYTVDFSTARCRIVNTSGNITLTLETTNRAAADWEKSHYLYFRHTTGTLTLSFPATGKVWAGETLETSVTDGQELTVAVSSIEDSEAGCTWTTATRDTIS